MHSRPPPPLRREFAPCPVCRAEGARPYRPGMYRIGEERFDLVRCACGMVYVNPRPDGATVGWMYDDPDYYTHGYNLGVETDNYFTRREELVAQYEATARALAQELGGAGELYEIGAAGGFFLEGARRAGFHVRGAELSPPAIAYARGELGLDIHEGEFEDAPIPDASLDVVYADNVLEHSLAPDLVLASVWKRLKPGGHLVVIVPTYVNSPYFRLLDRARRSIPRGLLGGPLLKLLKLDAQGDNGLPYHVLEFDRRALERLVAAAGFWIVRAERSVPLPAHLFKAERPDLRTLALRGVFLGLDLGMRAGFLPGARVWLLARKPYE
ncbi:MAG: class I SAM-dependent methyltransferase [Planctomycetes bacterium]|nr:class I SAM-dependent methyltransferase [Planctomycetota bacterium]